MPQTMTDSQKTVASVCNFEERMNKVVRAAGLLMDNDADVRKLATLICNVRHYVVCTSEEPDATMDKWMLQTIINLFDSKLN